MYSHNQKKKLSKRASSGAQGKRPAGGRASAASSVGDAGRSGTGGGRPSTGAGRSGTGAGRRSTGGRRPPGRGKLRISRLVTILVAAGIAGYALHFMFERGFALLGTNLRADVEQLLDSTVSRPDSPQAYALLSRKLSGYLARQSGEYAVAGLDLTDGLAFGVNPHARFTAAGTSALPISLYLYSLVADKLLSPAQTIPLTAADKVAGPGYIAGMPDGTRFTLAQLARAALVNNDLTARRMLRRFLGTKAINDYLAHFAGGQLAKPDITTPLALAHDLRELDRLWLAHPRAISPLMIDLAHVPGNRLRSGLQGAPLWQVVGDWPREFADAGLTIVHGRMLAIVVCSDDVSSTQAARVEGHVAAMVRAFADTGR
jgi:hypothetical protein